MTTFTIYQTSARCPDPRCRRPVALRITEAERDLAMSQAAGVLKATEACHRTHCDTIVPILARHYQEAKAIGTVTISGDRIAGMGTQVKGG